MGRKKKESLAVLEAQPIVEYVINWDKIAADVKAAAEMVPSYPADNGPLTEDQIRQIKETAPKPKRKSKKT